MLEAPKVMMLASESQGISRQMQELVVINVVCQKFFRKISFTEIPFGLADLTKPEGPRSVTLFLVATFLSKMENVDLFLKLTPTLLSNAMICHKYFRGLSRQSASARSFGVIS